MTKLFDPARAKYAARPAAVLALALGLAVGGCQVNNEELEQAQRQKEALQAELSKLQQGNDQLNQEITRLYGDREVISSHVALTAALTLHNRLAGELGKPRPAPPAAAQTPPARPPAPPPPPPVRPGSAGTAAAGIGRGGTGAPPPAPMPPGGLNPRPLLDLNTLPPVGGAGSGRRTGGAVDWGQ